MAAISSTYSAHQPPRHRLTPAAALAFALVAFVTLASCAPAEPVRSEREPAAVAVTLPPPGSELALVIPVSADHRDSRSQAVIGLSMLSQYRDRGVAVVFTPAASVASDDQWTNLVADWSLDRRGAGATILSRGQARAVREQLPEVTTNVAVLVDQRGVNQAWPRFVPAQELALSLQAKLASPSPAPQANQSTKK